MAPSHTDHPHRTLAELFLSLLVGVVIVSLLELELVPALIILSGLVVIYLLYRLVTTAEEIAEKL
ncbi:hypothetical protein C495_16470 [Natronorubrum sulfidifaciens JCM 14089]|uniref:Uncharacterized protein n=1 Tax=Natronorubrum sulfidifaciens JCM 14089 TaxID=1230460 RepID=L9VX96_9EURY|nr:hypothetical protein C495_16470 [Natronorubrum sulfidifaciens JCM 14089]